MSISTVRVRFAPSPTGGLHIGGVRTALFNYLFARKHGGRFILRIEDTDQNRFVPGAEDYIMECLQWCGLLPDESPIKGGTVGPYRQSERKQIYRSYAEQLVAAGHAYYAFDTPEELEAMRARLKTEAQPSPQYDGSIRGQMKNSLTLSSAETEAWLSSGKPYVVRILMPQNETIRFTDMIRGEVSFHTSVIDDKVLLKADGMPTYHLAVVVDDYLMQISHVFRGEEWLPSAPVHLLLWKFLGWEQKMPLWAHLPLILKPDGHGKLSKRDGDRLGFPVFAMNWADPATGMITEGFRERGFVPEAFINMLALLGWNDGSGQEIFSREELTNHFSIERVHKGGARFDYEKAQWLNHEWIKKMSAEDLLPYVRLVLKDHQIGNDETRLLRIIGMVKDRCTLLGDFAQQAGFFFEAPASFDRQAIQSKWNETKAVFFREWTADLASITHWESKELEQSFKAGAEKAGLKAGELMLPLRVMLVGGKFGPPVFDIMEVLGPNETSRRVAKALDTL